MKKLYSLFLLLLPFLSATAQKELPLYIGTYTNSGSYGVYVAKFDLTTGIMLIVDSLQADNPSYLALNSTGDRLYAVSENAGTNPGAVVSFLKEGQQWKKLNATPIPTGGDHPCYISIDSKSRYAIVANYSSGSLSVLPIDKNGSIRPAVQLIQQYGSSVNSSRQQSPHVHTAIFSPQEKYVVIADLGTDMVKAYPFKPESKTPLDTQNLITIRSTPGSGPRHIAFHPTLNTFYVMGELSGKVSVHAFRKKRIVRLQTIQGDTTSKLPGSADIHVHPNGRFLYASHRAQANDISVYSIDANDGKLTPVAHQSVMGIMPRNFTIDPTGRFLLAANQKSNNITIFSIDEATGNLQFTGEEIKLPSPVCLVFTNSQ
jgi:6-phosphogluconolactonase